VIAGDNYGPFLVAQLAEERLAKTSLEQRGLAVVTTSGALATVVVGIAALVDKQRSAVDIRAAVLIAVGGAGFALAAMLGLGVNRPRGYGEADDDWLTNLTDEEVWTGDGQLGARRVAECNVGILSHHRKVNRRKANLLLAALASEVGAVVVLTAAAASLLIFRGSCR
jgi:hypothetical protein